MPYPDSTSLPPSPGLGGIHNQTTLPPAMPKPVTQGKFGPYGVAIAVPNPNLTQQAQPPKPTTTHHVAPALVKPIKPGPTSQELGKTVLQTADQLRKTIGVDPSKDFKVGITLKKMSTHYKDVLSHLDQFHAAVAKATTVTSSHSPTFIPVMRQELGQVMQQLKSLDQSLQGYADAAKTGHKTEMAELRKAVQAELKLLQGLDQEMASGKTWPPNLDVRTALVYLRGNPSLGLDGLNVAVQHGMTEADVHAYAKANIPLRESSLPGGAQLKGPLTELGSGATGTVFKGQFQLADGTPMQGVFKAEKPMQLMPDVMGAIGIDTTQPNLPLRAVATARLDKALGFGLVPHSELMLHQGQLGLMMGLADGHAPLLAGDFKIRLTADAALRLKNDPALFEQIKKDNKWLDAKLEGDHILVTNSFEDIVGEAEGKTLTAKGTKDSVVLFDMKSPSLRRELTRLQWLDALTGQVDRHGHNYMISRGQDGQLHVTAIDNDMAFGKNTVHANDVNSASSRADKFDKGGNARHGAKLPEVIDKQTRDALMALKHGDLNDLLGGLISPEELTATQLRLSEIQQHISVLDKSGRVYDTDQQWALPEADSLLGIPNFTLLDQQIKASNDPYVDFVPAVNKAMTQAQDSSYVARESTLTHLAMNHKNKPAVFPEQLG